MMANLQKITKKQQKLVIYTKQLGNWQKIKHLQTTITVNLSGFNYSAMDWTDNGVKNKSSNFV